MGFLIKLKNFYQRHMWVIFGTSGVLAILNFGALLYVTAQIGGDAMNGKIEAGHYFVGDHGVYTEVSRKVWVFSYLHTSSMIFTHGFFLLNAFLQYFLRDTDEEEQD